jgi:hypothetical protein
MVMTLIILKCHQNVTTFDFAYTLFSIYVTRAIDHDGRLLSVYFFRKFSDSVKSYFDDNYI